MDDIDARILHILSDNANATATEIGAAVNLSIPAVNKRIHKLQQEGTIRRFTVLTREEKVGKPITAFVLLVLQSASHAQILLDYVEADPDILECYAVTGEYDYILRLCAADVKALEDKLLCLKRRKGVVKSHTMLALMEHKFRPSPLPDIPGKEFHP